MIGPTQTITYESKLVLRGTASSASGPHYTAYVTGSQYPTFNNLNFTNNNISLNFDAYFDGQWRSSYLTSNYQIYKVSDQLQFGYGSSVSPGSILTWNTAGYVDTSGIMNWNKTIKTADTTDASNTTTGSLRTAGGLGVTKKAYVGDSLKYNKCHR